MTITEAIIKSLNELKTGSNYMDIYNHMVSSSYYDFKNAKTPSATISAYLGDFIRNGDSRVKRVKGKGGTFLYYLTKNEEELNLEALNQPIIESRTGVKSKTYKERDLHVLLSTYLKSTAVFSKTIFHESSKNSKDNHQKWIHPDMVGIKFLKLQTKVTQSLLNVVNKTDTFKITSYELKREINTDYELKKSFFQAVSNSSWSNYGYLVAFEISNSLADEMERLNQSFGIGIIELSPNPYESKVLFPAKYSELDFKTIDKLSKINVDFEKFIEQSEKLLTANERYFRSTEKELNEFCDDYLLSESEIEKYCKDNYIPTEKNTDNIV